MSTTQIFIAIGSFITGGGLLKLLDWWTKNKKAVADGWQGYAKNLEDRISKVETDSDAKIKALEELMEKREAAHNTIIDKKNDRIQLLEDRVEELETIVKRYESVEEKVSAAKDDLHASVERNMDSLAEPTQKV